MPGPPTNTDRAERLTLRWILESIKPKPDNALIIKDCLVIWVAVHSVLRLDSQLAGSLADQDQFLANVDRLGVERFCNLVRDAKEENGTWGELLRDGEIPPSPFSKTVTFTLCLQSP